LALHWRSQAHEQHRSRHYPRGPRAGCRHLVQLPGRGRRRLCRRHDRAGAGQSGAAGDEYAQAKEIFGKIRDLVEAAGGNMADVVKVTIFVTDISQRDKVWQARREFFTGNFPTSTLVQVAALADPSLKVEINAVAHIGASKR
jgi:hypothetical protein